jgi:hypothetical protein
VLPPSTADIDNGRAQVLSAKEGLGDPAPHLATPRLDPDVLNSSLRLVPHSLGLFAACNRECPPFAPRVSDDHTEGVSAPSKGCGSRANHENSHASGTMKLSMTV